MQFAFSPYCIDSISINDRARPRAIVVAIAIGELGRIAELPVSGSASRREGIPAAPRLLPDGGIQAGCLRQRANYSQSPCASPKGALARLPASSLTAWFPKRPHCGLGPETPSNHASKRHVAKAWAWREPSHRGVARQRAVRSGRVSESGAERDLRILGASPPVPLAAQPGFYRATIVRRTKHQ